MFPMREEPHPDEGSKRTWILERSPFGGSHFVTGERKCARLCNYSRRLQMVFLFLSFVLHVQWQSKAKPRIRPSGLIVRHLVVELETGARNFVFSFHCNGASGDLVPGEICGSVGRGYEYGMVILFVAVDKINRKIERVALRNFV